MHIEITDAAGARWVGDSSDEPLSNEDRQAIDDLLANFKDLNKIRLVIGGSKHYFNPAHIVAVSIHEEG